MHKFLKDLAKMTDICSSKVLVGDLLTATKALIVSEVRDSLWLRGNERVNKAGEDSPDSNQNGDYSLCLETPDKRQRMETSIVYTR